MTGENRQQQRAEHVALARRIRTGERQRAVRHPAVEQATSLQVFNEERQLTERRHRLRSIPLDVHPTAERVGNRRPFLNLRLLTRRVSQRNRQICRHLQAIRRFGGSAQGSTAASRMTASQSKKVIRVRSESDWTLAYPWTAAHVRSNGQTSTFQRVS